MIQKVKQQYYEMGFHLMSGVLVDETLAPQLEAILSETREKVKKLVLENKEHILETNSCTVYPRGKRTEVSLSMPKGMFDLNLNQKLKIMDSAMCVNKVEHVFVSDERGEEKVKAFAQRAIEDDLDAKGGSL